ncbi:MAG: fimbrial protein [Eubacteriales bacterium]|nr:fimbrial protein [Eubacteriales bacterium]
MKQIRKESPPIARRQINYGKWLYIAFLLFTLVLGNVQPVLAANMWDKAKEIMKDVYSQIVLISTIAAVVTASVALLLMNFSKSGKTVDESRAWLKRIIITWAILNGLGFIMAYITPFFAGGQWNG